MAKYLIRLDDACQTMNHRNWRKIEKMLDKYKVQPIVGIIPDNLDKDFYWKTDTEFWEKARQWQSKGWTIALHGLHHNLTDYSGKGYFQLSHSRKTEFAGKSIDEQNQMLKEGIRILRSEGIYPRCFFAPCHTFDRNTVLAIHENPEIQFISDGYALRPYRKGGGVFIPSICDGPFSFPAGVFTFVFHPSFMRREDFQRLGLFLETEHKKIISSDDLCKENLPGQGIAGICAEYGIYIARMMRNKIKKG